MIFQTFTKKLILKNYTNKIQYKNRMDIESYFASLSEDIKIIDIANKGITHIPESILKFKKLEVLHCRGNLLSSLPQLPESLKKLYCPSNQLTSLPVLNEKLEKLFCYNNKLTSLPLLNENLKLLDCHDNELTSLPVLNEKLQSLYCRCNKLSSLPSLNTNLITLNCNYNNLTSLPVLNEKLEALQCSHNQLTSLPVLNEKLEYLECSENQLYYLPNPNTNLRAMYFHDNPIYEIIKYDDELSTTKQKIKILNDFRESYYCLKFKKRLRDWLWIRIREPRIRERFHPRYLLENLCDEETDLDEVLDHWVNEDPCSLHI
jgi:Leucine-rich repeat (LRR) protein